MERWRVKIRQVIVNGDDSRTIAEAGLARDIFNAPGSKESGPVSPLPGSEGLCFVAALVPADTILEKREPPFHCAEIAAHGAGRLVFRLAAVAYLAHLFRKHR